VVNPLAFKVLRLLSEREFRSGEFLSRSLAVSRASVSRVLMELEGSGVGLRKIRGRGYQLAQPLDWLDAERVAAALGERRAQIAIEISDEVPSTNTLLMQRGALNARSGACIVAELQTAGRGRRGRGWYVPLCGALTLSLLWRFARGAALLSSLSLVVGIALIRALEELGVTGAKMKWPNDIVHHHHKLGGILIELQGDVLGPSAAVIGIGLNFRLDPGTVGQIDQAVTDLNSIMDPVPGRSEALGVLLRNLAGVLEQFEADGFARFHDEWLSYHAYHNKQVRIRLPDGTHHDGLVTGVAEDGSLVVASGSAARRYTVGEISLRGAGVATTSLARRT
jgi:BirA family transcriptional regulator, biotin operon repressor / biotin---[acetyl-CoA-carboxylase] ligase